MNVQLAGTVSKYSQHVQSTVKIWMYCQQIQSAVVVSRYSQHVKSTGKVRMYSQQVPACGNKGSIWSIQMCHIVSVLVSEISNVYGRTWKLSRNNFYTKKWRHHTRDVIVVIVILTAWNVVVLVSLSTVKQTEQLLMCYVSASGVLVQHTGTTGGQSDQNALVGSTSPPHPRGLQTVTEQQ